MQHRQRFLWLTLVLCFLVFAAACSQPALGDLPSIKAIKLTHAEKAYVLNLARAYVTESKVPAVQKKAVKNVYQSGERGAFVTVPREGDAALTGYGVGDNVAKAVEAAARELRSIARDESYDRARLRVDVIERTKKPVTYKFKDRWRMDVSREGLIFATKPPVAFLPQELRDCGVIDHQDRFRTGPFKRLMGQRGIKRDVRGQFDTTGSIKAVPFAAISFMEDGAGNVLDLRRGNRIDGFEPTAQNLLTTIEDVGKYLTQAVRQDGSFEYLYFPQTDRVSRSYNELRHAGTTFSMFQIYEITKSPETLAAATRALGWLERHARGPAPRDAGKHDWMAVNDTKFEYAKLGGSGLSLLAFGWYTRVTGDLQYVPLMEKMAEFIEYMMKDDGDVRMRYYYADKDEDKKVKPVLYYPGEAFFGLATLSQLDGNLHWIDVASRGIDFIVDIRDKKKADTSLPHDHWMAYSIRNIHLAKPKDSHVQHMWRLFTTMDARFNRNHADPDFNGGYYTRRNMLSSVSAACRLEATGSFYRLAEQVGDQERMDEFFTVMQLGATFLMRNQFDDVNTMFFSNPVKPRGGLPFGYWRPEIQIDFVQHSVSALIETYLATMERAGTPLVLDRPGDLANQSK